MLISMNLIFSWLSDFQPFCAPELDTSIRLSSVKLLYEYEKEVSPEVLYVCTFEELTQFLRTHDLQKISLISVLCLAERIEELKSLPKGINWIWISGSFHRSMIYNTLYDLFYTLRQWDNRLVEIILDEQGLQAMLDISEEIIPYYTLIWDAMFIIHAHSTHIPLESKALYKEIEQGYLSKEQVDQIIQRKLAANSDFISTRYIPGEQLFSGTGGLFHNVFHNGARFL